MTARFAGSRTLDERRRRWLASHELEQPAPSRSQKSGGSSDDTAEAAQVQVTHFPVRKIISPKGWKIALVGVVTLLLGAALIAAAHLGTAQLETLGPGWKRLFPVGGGGLLRLFQAGLLIVSGQVALLVWWVRSRSLRDFDGHYHVWLWAAMTVVFTGMGLLGEWHWAWSETFCWLSPTHFPQREVLCWMLPATLMGGVIWKKLRADMRDCQTSSLVFWTVGICYLGACAFRLKLDEAHWPDMTRQLIGTSLQMLACAGVFLSFLAHARFVLHVSAEPPAVRPSLGAKLMQRIFAVLKKLPMPRFRFDWKSRLRFPKKTKTASAKSKPSRKKAKAKAKSQPKQTESPPSPTEETTESNPSPKPASRRTSRRKTTKSRSKPQAADPPQDETTAPSPTKEPESKAAEKAPASAPQPKQDKPQTNEAKASDSAESPAAENQKTSHPSDSSEPQLRLDEPLDPEMLKGLSKKERRRLRKLHRDGQRKK